MKTKYFFGVNNFSGVHIKGLENSVYDLKKEFPKIDIIDEVLEKEDNIIAKNFNTVVTTNNKLFNYSDKIIKDGYIPVLFGGDHSIAIGSISASANNYNNITILWIDAHSDIHNEKTTISKNIHGMPLSYLLGNDSEQLSNIGGFKPKILPENILFFGIRSLEDEEKEIIEKLNIKTYYYDEIKEKGLEYCFNEVLDYLKDRENIHLQFDFDSMDPKEFPAVSVPYKGGFTKKDVDYMFDKLLRNERIVAIDLVEYNKAFDIEGKSLDFATKLINKIME